MISWDSRRSSRDSLVIIVTGVSAVSFQRPQGTDRHIRSERRFPDSGPGRLAGRPDSSERPAEIAAQNQFDVGRRVLAANQTFGEIENFLGVIDPIQVETFARANAEVASVEIHIAADADV